MNNIKDCLIVAAGMGTRLKGLGDVKPLVALDGMPLIEHAMLAAARAGVDNFVVTIGYRAALVQTLLDALGLKYGWHITTAFNPDFLESNGLSVLSGEAHVKGEFYLAMCDHIVEPSLYHTLANARLPKGAVGLGVDMNLANPAVDIDDVTKVELEHGLIRNIGKNLTSFDGYDTGIFRANPRLFSAIRTSRQESQDCSISGGMKILADKGLAIGVDVGTLNWFDVDSIEMHSKANDWLQNIRE